MLFADSLVVDGKAVLAQAPAVFSVLEQARKETALIELCQGNRVAGAAYWWTPRTPARATRPCGSGALLDQADFKSAVL